MTYPCWQAHFNNNSRSLFTFGSHSTHVLEQSFEDIDVPTVGVDGFAVFVVDQFVVGPSHAGGACE